MPKPTKPHPCIQHAPGLALMLALALALSLGTPDDAQAYTRRNGEARAQRLGKTKFDQGSAETTRERERRLLRECKGRPNAGACEGYAR